MENNNVDPYEIYTYDVYFEDAQDSNNKGFKESYAYCLDYILTNNGTETSYFTDYKGGTVSIVRNESGETVYEELVK